MTENIRTFRYPRVPRKAVGLVRFSSRDREGTTLTQASASALSTWDPGEGGRVWLHIPSLPPLGAALWVQVGEEADASLYSRVQPWPSGLDACYSSSSSTVWGRTVAAPACQVERDSCPNLSLVP